MISYKIPEKTKKYIKSHNEGSIYKSAKKIKEKIIKNASELESGDFSKKWSFYKKEFIINQGNGKCGFCETRILAATAGTIDHFYPKTAVREALDQGTRKEKPIKLDRVVKLSSSRKLGYWWMAYRWENWVFACNNCNCSWKIDQFPLSDNITTFENGPVIYEPLLINPFSANVENNFKFNIFGDIDGLNERAKATINVFGLDRWDLVEERRRLIDDFLRCEADYLVALSEKSEKLVKSILARVATMCEDHASYAGMIRCLYSSRKKFGKFEWNELIALKKIGKIK